MMRALFIKDLRMQRHVMVLAAVLLFGPAIVYTLVEIGTAPTERMLWHMSVQELREDYSQAMGIGTMLSMLAFPAVAAVAAARERKDRSAEFLEALPVTRRRIVASRLLAVAICCPAPLLIGIALSSALTPVAWSGHHFTWEELRLLLIGAGIGVSLAGVAWMTGSAAKSEVLAALVSLLAVATVSITTYGVIERMQLQGAHLSDRTVQIAFLSVAGVLGVVSFVLGTAIAVRRRTP
jgi:ABC-type transport system involved in multi-copper enzyme maturation permease subunit